jgi:hypothetical protein
LKARRIPSLPAPDGTDKGNDGDVDVARIWETSRQLREGEKTAIEIGQLAWLQREDGHRYPLSERFAFDRKARRAPIKNRRHREDFFERKSAIVSRRQILRTAGFTAGAMVAPRPESNSIRRRFQNRDCAWQH